MRSSRRALRATVFLVAPAMIVALPAAGRSAAAKKPKPIGTIEVVKDDVFLAGTFITGQEQLYRGRAVRTSKGGKARLDLDQIKDTDCRVRSRTTLIIGPAPKVALRITGVSGQVWCGPKKAKGSAIFESNNSRITTKDPVFGLVVNKRRTVVKVRRGAVVVAGRSGRARAVIVTGGRQAVVPPGGDPLQPQPIALTAEQRAVSKSLAAVTPLPKDTTPPSVTLLKVPSDPSAETLVTISFTVGQKDVKDVTYACAFDGPRFHVCSPPVRRRLGPGRHTFAVRAVDSAGNVSKKVTYAWTISAGTPQIAFVSDRDGNAEIYVANPDGTGLSRWTTNPADDQDPDWSPDRGGIAFHSDRDDRNPDIYVLDWTGVRRLTANPAIDRNPTWSPDGSQIAFESYRDRGNRDIYVMNAFGGGLRRLTTDLAQDLDPAWSPDGKRITFASVRDGNYEIYVMNADGTGQTRLTFNSVFEYGPAWSPDGGKIAFHSNRDANYEIYLMNPDGTGQTRLTMTAWSEYNPAWSPDGTRITFQTDRDGASEIYVMNRNGGGQTNVTRNPAVDIVPDW